MDFLTLIWKTFKIVSKKYKRRNAYAEKRTVSNAKKQGI